MVFLNNRLIQSNYNRNLNLILIVFDLFFKKIKFLRFFFVKKRLFTFFCNMHVLTFKTNKNVKLVGFYSKKSLQGASLIIDC